MVVTTSRRGGLALIMCLLALAGCARPAIEEGRKQQFAGIPKGVRKEAIARICATAPCLGKLSTIEVWREKGGAVGRLYYSGDFRVCSHPPSVYYNAEGVELKPVANEPIVPGNRQFFEELHARHRSGLTMTDRIRASCTR